MKEYLVIPEGLSEDEDGRHYPSDFYIAALDEVSRRAENNDRIYLAPANYFSGDSPEDYHGMAYLKSIDCKGEIIVIGHRADPEKYLDTLDNAQYLERFLKERNQWPIGPVIMICNRPHKLRSLVVFKLCGYSIKEAIGTRPRKRSGSKMVRRLWFYDNLAVQYIYEAIAIVYDSFRFLVKPK